MQQSGRLAVPARREQALAHRDHPTVVRKLGLPDAPGCSEILHGIGRSERFLSDRSLTLRRCIRFAGSRRTACRQKAKQANDEQTLHRVSPEGSPSYRQRRAGIELRKHQEHLEALVTSRTDELRAADEVAE